MKQPEAFRAFAQSPHQDIHLEASSLDELVRFMLSSLGPDQRRKLRRYLDHLLATLTPAEMKGVLNRASSVLRFETKGAAEPLHRAAEQLRVAGT